MGTYPYLTRPPLSNTEIELGPCRPTEGGENTTYNQYSWNSNANVIFLDQVHTPSFKGFR